MAFLFILVIHPSFSKFFCLSALFDDIPMFLHCTPILLAEYNIAQSYHPVLLLPSYDSWFLPLPNLRQRKTDQMPENRWTSLFSLVGGLEHFLFSIIYGMSSFPLTFIFFRGVGQPPSSSGWTHVGVSENSVPLFTQWLMIIIPIKWL